MQPGFASSLRDDGLQTRIDGGLVVRLLLPLPQEVTLVLGNPWVVQVGAKGWPMFLWTCQ